MEKENPDDIVALYANSVMSSRSTLDAYQATPSFQFHPRARPNPHDLCSHLIRQLTLLGIDDIHFKRVGDWFIFTANQDWMTLRVWRETSPTEQFQKMVFFDEFLPNTNRCEVAINAFSQAVLIADQTQVTVISGDILEDDPIWQHVTTNHPRTLAFLFPFAGRIYDQPED